MVHFTVLDHIAWARHEGLRSGSLVQRRYHLERLASWLKAGPGELRPVDLLAATPEHLRAWQTWLAAPERDLRASTRRSYISHARAFYSWAVDAGLAVDARVLRVLKGPKVPRNLPRPIPKGELVVALQNAPRRLLPWLLLGAYAGLRACEVAPLSASDIDLHAGTLFVVEGKGGRQRMVTLGPELVSLLRPLLPAAGYLFPALTRGREPIPGSHVSAGQVSHLASAYLHELQIESTFHALRHRYGSDVWAATKDLRLLQELLGHQSPASAAIYTLVAPDRYAAAAAAVSSGLGDMFTRPRLVQTAPA